MCGAIGRSGRRAWIGLPAKTLCPPTWIGTSGSARRRGVLTNWNNLEARHPRPRAKARARASVGGESIILRIGAAGRTSAPARSGDMACHTANMPFRALKLGYPAEVEAECSAINKETYPLKSKIRFEFPAREGLPPVTFWWYDGGNPKADNPFHHDGNNKPPKEVTADVEDMMDKIPGSGCLLIGDKGKLFSPRRLRRAVLRQAQGRAGTDRRQESTKRSRRSRR